MCQIDRKVDLKSPLVSILIPCYNSEKFIGEAIRSAFHQSYSQLEVIVVDDGSTDESLACAKRLKNNNFPDLIVLSHPDRANYGVSTSRYRAFMEASGKYVAFLDADDQFELEKIEKQVMLLQQFPDVVLCHTGITVFGDQSQVSAHEGYFGRYPAEPYNFRQCSDYLRRNRICNSSVMVKTDILRKVPFAMPQLFQYEDWICWSLVSAHGKFIFLDEKLTRYRIHGKSATAAVMQNPLREQYSLLEFKLALVVKSESLGHSLKCLFSAGQTLLNIMWRYMMVSPYPLSEKLQSPNLLSRFWQRAVSIKRSIFNRKARLKKQ